MTPFRRLYLAFAPLSLLLPALRAYAGADNYVVPSGNWSVNTSWSLQHAPASTDDVTISFTVTGVSVALDVSATINSLTIESSHAPNTLSLNGSNKLATSKTSLLAGGVLLFNGGSLLMNGNPVASTLPGISGSNLDATAGTLTFTSGTLDLSGGNGGTGSATLPGGTGGNGGDLLLGNGSSIVLSAGSSIFLQGGKGGSPGTAAGAGGNAGDITLDTGSQLILAGGNLSLAAGPSTSTPGAAGAIDLAGGSLTATEAQIAATNGSLAFTSGTLHLTDPAITIGDGSIVSNSLGGNTWSLPAPRALLLNSDLSAAANKTLSISGGTLDLSGRSDGANAHALLLSTSELFTMTGGHLLLAGANSSLTSAGNAANLSLSNPSDVLTLGSNSSLILSGGNSTAPSLSVGGAGGQLNLLFSNSVLVGPGGIVDLHGGNCLSGLGGNGGSLTITNATVNITGGVINLAGGSGSLTNGSPGNLTLAGGSLSLPANQLASILPAGRFNFTGGELDFTDTSPVTLSPATFPASSLSFSGFESFICGAALTVTGGFSLQIIGGAFAVPGQNLTLSPSASFSFNAGQIDLHNPASGQSAGSLDLNGSITLNPTATLLLQGTDGASGVTATNGGNGGDLIIESGGQVVLAGGTLNLAPGAAGVAFGGNLTASPPSAGTAGAIVLNGGSLTSNASQLAASNGTLSFLSGTLHLTDPTGLTIGDASVLANALGHANASLTANQTLLLDGPFSLPASRAFTLAGGTLDLAGHSPQGFGSSLTTNAASAFTMTSGLLSLNGFSAPITLQHLPGIPGNAGNIALSGGANVSITPTSSITLNGGNADGGISGGSAGNITLANGATFTFVPGGLLTALGGAGGSVPLNTIAPGGLGGAGGNFTLLSGGSLTASGGTLDLSGGVGGTGYENFTLGNITTTFPILSPSAPNGMLLLNGGALNVNTSLFALRGNFQFTAGTLHILDAAGLATNANTPYNSAIGGGSAFLSASQSLAVDNTLTLSSNTSLTVAGALQFGMLNIQSNAYLSLLTPYTSDTPISLATTASLFAPSLTLNGGTLSGSGNVFAPVIAGNAPHTIHPTTLTLLGLTTNPNTTLAFNLTSPGNNDQLTIAAANQLSLRGGTLQLLSTPTTLGYYPLIQYTGAFSGTLSSLALPTSTNPNLRFSLDTTRNPNFIDLHIGFLGDANDDGKVDLTDLNAVLNNLGTTNSSWTSGNFDGATSIDLTDLNDVLNNLGVTYANSSAALSPAPTPEPTSLALGSLGTLALLSRRRRP